MMGIDQLKLLDDAPRSLCFSDELFVRLLLHHSFSNSVNMSLVAFEVTTIVLLAFWIFKVALQTHALIKHW